MSQNFIQKRIDFLTFLPRTGSTLLAKKLHEFQDIDAGIEAEFIDGMNRGEVKIKNRQELEEYLDLTYNSVIKFRSWNINRTELTSRLLKKGFPIYFNHFLDAVLNLYFINSEAKIILHKSEGFHRYIPQIRELFPNTRFLHIDRDPRAMFNSQRRSIDSVKKTPIGTDPVKFAIIYKKNQSIIHRFKDKQFFKNLKYKDLIEDEDKTIKSILKFLGASEKREKNKQDYHKNIPEDQRHLHKNVSKDFVISSRKAAWQHELDPEHILFLQTVLKKEITDSNYPLIKIKSIGIDGRLKYMKYRILFFRGYSLPLIVKTRLSFLYKILKK